MAESESRQNGRWVFSDRAWALGVLLLGSIAAASCSSAVAETSPRADPTVLAPTTSSSTTLVEGTLAPSPSTTAVEENGCPTDLIEPAPVVPEAIIESLTAALAHPGFDDLDVSISVWIDGWGEVAALNPEMLLNPASNQKLLVAYGVNELLEADVRFRTTMETVGSDLVLRAGADPTLTFADVEAMARTVAATGTVSADHLVIDVSPYPQQPRADGWLDWQIPRYVGPLSGLMIDDNQWTTIDEFVSTPALVNGQRVLEIFTTHGIEVPIVIVAEAPPGDLLASHESAPLGQIVEAMLRRSDNQHADMLLMELGRRVNGRGTLAAGGDAVDRALAELCVPLAGSTDDGSGLSRGNLRSARELRTILNATGGTEVGDQLREQLPVGGVSGTMRSRFGGDVGRVQAKTGTIIGGRALSGFATTDSGRDVVFSIIVNGEAERASGSLAAIDALVTTVLRT